MSMPHPKDKQIERIDVEGNFDLEVDIKDTAPYEYYYREWKGSIYLIYRYGEKDEWKEKKTLLTELPYSTF